MIRGFFRLIGLLLLAGGFIFVVYDGARWVADQNLRFTRFGQFWNDVHQSSQQAFKTWVEANVPWLWNSVVKVVLVTHVAGKPPLLAIDAGRRLVPLNIKPSFAQLERWINDLEGRDSAPEENTSRRGGGRAKAA